MSKTAERGPFLPRSHNTIMDIGDHDLSALSIPGGVDGDPSTPPLSPLQRLPTELKRQIISYVIPQGLTPIFAQRPSRYSWSNKLSCGLDTRDVDDYEQPAYAEVLSLGQRKYKSLIHTSRDLSIEARFMPTPDNHASPLTPSQLWYTTKTSSSFVPRCPCLAAISVPSARIFFATSES
jgi:hypothetical protein